MAQIEFDREAYRIKVSQPVQWGEMDAFGHVNNTVYFRYFENARIRFLDETGMMTMMEKHKVGPILARIDCNFVVPVLYPDTITTYVKVKKVGTKSFTLEEVSLNKEGIVVAYGDAILVLLDYKTNESVAIPSDLREKLETEF